VKLRDELRTELKKGRKPGRAAIRGDGQAWPDEARERSASSPSSYDTYVMTDIVEPPETSLPISPSPSLFQRPPIVNDAFLLRLVCAVDDPYEDDAATEEIGCEWVEGGGIFLRVR
jgi:hypothetical protein